MTLTRKLQIATAVVACAAAASSAGWRAAAARQGVPSTGGKPQQGPAAVVPLRVKRPPGLRGEIQQQLDDAEQKLIALASAVPPEKFGWRPAPGVRSFGEVCLHVAGGNYEIGGMWGLKPPAGVDLQKIEQQGADKGNAVAAMRVSFEQLRASIAAMPDSEVEKSIDYFGHPGTVRLALIEAAVHAHEHLGQAIAYARMNGIVPPWTAAAISRRNEKTAPKATGR
ncbi:MAG: DinB family protein [Acidobacteria bacterium]|nr:DinB family protein [Acidobacteriota bacterium]